MYLMVVEQLRELEGQDVRVVVLDCYVCGEWEIEDGIKKEERVG